MNWIEDLQQEARDLLPGVTEVRRALHRKPELGNDLPETRALVLEALSDLDLEIELSEETSSVVATLKGGAPGPCVLLRADMDALPMPEDSGLEFASEIPGRMHACGHDGHTTILIGAARGLARIGRQQELPRQPQQQRRHHHLPIVAARSWSLCCHRRSIRRRQQMRVALPSPSLPPVPHRPPNRLPGPLCQGDRP